VDSPGSICGMATVVRVIDNDRLHEPGIGTGVGEAAQPRGEPCHVLVVEPILAVLLALLKDSDVQGNVGRQQVTASQF